MLSEKELISPLSSPERPPKFELRRRATMDRIRTSLKSNPIISKNRTMVNSYLQAESKTSDDLDNLESSSTFSDQYPNQGSPNFSFEQKYEVLEKLGEGSNGVVHRCLKKATDEIFAVKSFRFEDQHIPGLKSNFLVLKRLQHPYILKYKGLYLDLEKHLGHLVMEYTNAPCLTKSHIESQSDLKNIMHQLLMAINYLHKQDVAHRDIKPENILYDPVDKVIKLIDFGISRRYRRRGTLFEMWTITGTLYYRAPQMFEGGYKQGIDVWAAGILLYQLVYGSTPFESQYHSQTIQNIRNGDLTFPSQYPQIDHELKQLISRMLTRNPDQRPSACQCLRDIWFYSAHNHHKKKQLGSLKVIKDDMWKGFETCDQFQSCKELQKYEPMIGSLKRIDLQQSSVSNKKVGEPCQAFTRKMSRNQFAFDTNLNDLDSASSVHSMKFKMKTTNVMRASGFF